MCKVAFVILHYITVDDTVECVESILKNIDYDDKEIIIVDNGSPNSSGHILEKQYCDYDNVKVLISDKNLGFAKGNNVGYEYAKKELNADFIILLNNDTIIEDCDFIDKIINVYKETNYYVLGPDIISLKSGQHQNPYRNKGMDKEEVKALIKGIKREQIKIFIGQISGKPDLVDSIKRILKKDKTLVSKHGHEVSHVERQFDVELHGSCLIFSPLYVAKFSEGLYSETFMYLEEDILNYLCKINNFRQVYEPSIVIYHKEDVATDAVISSDVKKRKFVLKHSLESAKILLRLMQQDK